MKALPDFKRSHARGYVLGLILVVMVVFSLILITIVSMDGASAADAGNQASRAQVTWAADGAVKQVIRRLEVDTSFRQNPHAINGQINHVDYNVIVKGGPTLYTIQATSQAGPWQHEASQSIELPPLPPPDEDD